MRTSNKYKIFVGLVACIGIFGIWWELHFHCHCGTGVAPVFIAPPVAVIPPVQKAPVVFPPAKIHNYRSKLSDVKVEPPVIIIGPKVGKSDFRPTTKADTKVLDYVEVPEPSSIILMGLGLMFILFKGKVK